MLTLRRDKEVTRTVLPEGVHVDGPRRAYTIDYKIKILRECAEPGASVAGVARRNDLNSNMVFRWRREYRQGRLTGGVSTAGGTTPAVEFVPVKITNNESAWKGTKKTRGKALALLLEKASEPRLLKLFFRTACVCGAVRTLQKLTCSAF